ncbi:MAG: hypothetical protein KAJ21_06035 [Thermoplasmatales archaeon]|nr:hypothetical protein [Thermoplasmatales archaeon]
MKKKILSIYLCMLLMAPFIVMTASANEPPTKPILTGPTNGKTGDELMYTFVSTDPDGDDISYCIQWGCTDPEVCLGPFPSGVEQSDSHSYAEGTYIIKVKARDANDAESDWATLEISVPKTKGIDLFFLRFLNQYPTLFTLLQKFLGL